MPYKHDKNCLVGAIFNHNTDHFEKKTSGFKRIKNKWIKITAYISFDPQLIAQNFWTFKSIQFRNALSYFGVA